MFKGRVSDEELRTLINKEKPDYWYYGPENAYLYRTALSKEMQFMAWAKGGAEVFSTCAKRKYMAILTDDNNHIVGTGYNGVPRGLTHCEDGGCPRLQEGSPSGSSYDNCYAIHAEQNAFLHSDYSARPTTLTVNGTPCFTCAKLVANSTVTKLVYIYDSAYADVDRALELLYRLGVELVEYSRLDYAS